MTEMHPVLDLDTSVDVELIDQAKFPSKVWVLAFPGGKYASYCFKRDDIHGIACFSTENNAIRFSEHIAQVGSTPMEVSFDETVEILIIRRRHVPNLKCIFLMDGNFDTPTATFWV